MDIYFQHAFFGYKTKIMVIYVHILGRTVPLASLIPWSTVSMAMAALGYRPASETENVKNAYFVQAR